MVRVFYEPPPYGPRTSLNRTPYGLGGGGLFGRNLEYWSKQRPSVAIGVPVAVCMVLAYAITSTYRALQCNWLEWRVVVVYFYWNE